jgi:hypothetical protein
MIIELQNIMIECILKCRYHSQHFKKNIYTAKKKGIQNMEKWNIT